MLGFQAYDRIEEEASSFIGATGTAFPSNAWEELRLRATCLYISKPKMSTLAWLRCPMFISLHQNWAVFAPGMLPAMESKGLTTDTQELLSDSLRS